MEQPKEPTPEERLYNIIKEGKPPEEAKSDTLLSMPEHFEPFTGPDPGINQKKARRAMAMGSIVHKALHSDLRRKLFTIPAANRFLGAAVVLGIVYFTMTQFSAKPRPADELMKRAGSMGISQNEIQPGLFSFDEAGRNFNVFNVRNIFRPWTPPPPSQTPAGAGAFAAPGEPQVFSGNLKLSGIYQGDVPEALIEATEELKTYTVTEGSVLKGLTVKKITADSVILFDGNTERVLK